MGFFLVFGIVVRWRWRVPSERGAFDFQGNIKLFVDGVACLEQVGNKNVVQPPCRIQSICNGVYR